MRPAGAAWSQTGSRATGLRLDRLSVRLPGQPHPLLRDVSLTVAPGEVVGLVGNSGCGKSTLLHAVAGLVPWVRPGAVSGAVLVDGEDITELDVAQRAHLLATCLDRPEAQLFLPNAGQELEAARALRAGSPLLDEVTDALGLSSLLKRRVVELSSGERQRLALAVALAASPRPVLLDEPTANLDHSGVAVLTAALGRLRRLGAAVLVTEHAGWRLGPAVDRWCEIRDGALHPCPPPTAPRFETPPPPSDRKLLDVRDLRLSRGANILLEGGALHLRVGEVVVLTGPNGAGKSTLARVLSGHSASAGSTSAHWVARPPFVALMLPSADLQLFADTVAGELEADGLDQAETARILRLHRLDALAGRAPWTLSRGERQRLVLAALDRLAPEVMVLDEPAQGLDPGALQDLAAAIALAAKAGRAHVVVTHRRELIGLGHRHLRLEDGRLIELERGA